MRPSEGAADRVAPAGTAGQHISTASVDAPAEAGKQAALTRLGEMLKATPKNTGAAGSAGPGRGNAVPIANRVSDVPTLADLGIAAFEPAAAERLAQMRKGGVVAACGVLEVNNWTTQAGEARTGWRLTASEVMTSYAATKKRRSAEGGGDD